jgi:hypothetical protein
LLPLRTLPFNRLKSLAQVPCEDGKHRREVVLVLLKSNKGKPSVHCLDGRCYHAGAPLDLGDIEDLNGKPQSALTKYPNPNLDGPSAGQISLQMVCSRAYLYSLSVALLQTGGRHWQPDSRTLPDRRIQGAFISPRMFFPFLFLARPLPRHLKEPGQRVSVFEARRLFWRVMH